MIRFLSFHLLCKLDFLLWMCNMMAKKSKDSLGSMQTVRQNQEKDCRKL